MAGDRFESVAFFFCEGDFVSWCHAANLTCKNRQVKMRNSKCYMILASSKETPCFLAFDAALLESHSKEISFIRKRAIQHIAHRSKAYFLLTSSMTEQHLLLALKPILRSRNARSAEGIGIRSVGLLAHFVLERI